MSTRVSMSKRAFVKEHVKLVKALKSGDKRALRKEAREQSAELKKVKANKNGKAS